MSFENLPRHVSPAETEARVEDIDSEPSSHIALEILPLQKHSAKETVGFEEQWGKPERVVFTGQTVVDMYDVRPEREEDAVPVALLPGWGGTPEMYRENARTLVASGRRTMSLDAPHGVSLGENERVAADARGIPETGMRRISAFMQELDTKNIQRVDAVAHSQGCLDLVLAATLYPEKFRNIVLVNPAGMIGKDSFWRLATGFSLDIVKGYASQIRKAISGGKQLNSGKEVMLEPMLRAIRSVNGSIAMNPVMAFREVLAISDAQIHELLSDLSRHGIGVSIIYSDEDRAFPADRMEQVIPAALRGQAHVFAGDHSSFQVDAEAVTTLAASLLREMAQEDATNNTHEPTSSRGGSGE